MERVGCTVESNALEVSLPPLIRVQTIYLTLLCTSGWTGLPLPSPPALGKASASTSSQDPAAKRPRLDQPQQPQAFMQAGMAAYPAAVGGGPGGVPGFVPPGMMPPYQMQRPPPPMTQAAPRGPLFPSAATAPVGSNSQPRQVRGALCGVFVSYCRRQETLVDTDAQW